ncbi:MAG: anion permease, partial [Pirellulales bacterium]|nr:anion permease [Pirellulales bacterium]
IELRAGDTLLLETHRGFVSGYRNSDDFYLVSDVPGSTPLRHEHGRTALVIFAALVAALAFSEAPPAIVALIAALAMVVTGCVTAGVARASVSVQVLAVIAAALGIGEALNQTGAATAVADFLLSWAEAFGFGPQGMLFLIVILTAAFAQVLSNNGAAALMFPIALATAAELDVSPEPFVFTLILGAGASFMTPIGYQTNLMVYGPGGYKFMDFVRMGTPLTVMIALLAAFLAPVAFPF